MNELIKYMYKDVLYYKATYNARTKHLKYFSCGDTYNKDLTDIPDYATDSFWLKYGVGNGQTNPDDIY